MIFTGSVCKRCLICNVVCMQSNWRVLQYFGRKLMCFACKRWLIDRICTVEEIQRIFVSVFLLVFVLVFGIDVSGLFLCKGRLLADEDCRWYDERWYCGLWRASTWVKYMYYIIKSNAVEKMLSNIILSRRFYQEEKLKEYKCNNIRRKT